MEKLAEMAREKRTQMTIRARDHIERCGRYDTERAGLQ
jgi:hypothetical protein